jgi:hypothetical protein
MLLAMIYKIIALLLVIFIVFSESAPAQIDVTNKFASITEDVCWIKGCKANDTSLALGLPDFRKAVDGAMAKGNRDFYPDIYLKNDPAKARDTDFRISKSIAQTSYGQASVFAKQLDESNPFSAKFDFYRNEGKGFGAKLLRASILTQTTQIANLMSMIAFPDAFNYSCSSWAEAKSNLHRAWTSAPVWDKDPWMTNFLGHPYAGGVYYNALRSQGASPRTSYLYSTSQSLLWEFVIEAVAEQPSIQDLLFTSNLGLVVGEISHRATIRMERNGFSTFEKILTTLINPAYVINNGFKKHHRTSVLAP